MLPVIVASTLGTTIEWYDFFLYGTVATLVFPALYFPKSAPFVGWSCSTDCRRSALVF
jgi:hypothetical protein